jgi:magnesium transporter
MQIDHSITQKTGLPPGTPIYIGDTPPEETEIKMLSYTDQQVSGFEPVSPSEITGRISDGCNAWISITGLQNAALIDDVLMKFSVHPLVIEDILNTRTRSKIEEFDDYLFIVLTDFKKSEDGIRENQINIILTNTVLITCCETSGPFENLEGRIHRATGRFRQNGIDYLAYSLIDTIVDGYFVILEEFEDRFEALEEEVVNAPNRDTISHVQFFRHELIWFRRKIWSLRELIIRLERTDSLLIRDSTHIYLRDVYDHGIKIAEDVDVYREMADGLMEIYLSKISNNTNEIMKMLTIIANIFIPLTFIAGIYGMNFEYMPELTSPYGYPAVLIGMGIVGCVMLGYFRKKEWI